MAYKVGGNQSPFVSSVSPTSVTAAGNTTFTIDGALFSPSMAVDVPSGLGSLVSVTITQPTSTTSRAVIVVNISEPPATATAYDIKLSNSGDSSANSSATITHTSWTPAALCTGSTDYWWNPDSLNATLSNNDLLNSFSSSAGGLTLVESSATYYPRFIKNFEWSSGKFASGVGQSTGSFYRQDVWFDDIVIPLTNAASGDLEQVTLAFVAKNLNETFNNQNRYPIMQIVSGVQATYKQSAGWYTSNSGVISNQDFSVSGAVARVIVTQDNGTEVFKVHPFGINQTSSYTPAPADTAASKMFRCYRGGPAMYGEMILINRVLTSSEITQLETYWNNKYGV